MIDINPWDRLPEESSKAFEAFKVFRDLGLKRNQMKVNEILRGKEGRGAMGVWAMKFKWAARANAYDRHLDRMETEAKAEAVAEMAKRHASIASDFILKVSKRLLEIDPAKLNNDQIIKWFEKAAKIERLSRGESTENIKNEHSGTISDNGIDLSKLDDDDLETVYQIVNKAHDKGTDREGDNIEAQKQPD